MTGLYLFAAAAGLPLIGWFLLSGNEEGDGEGIGGIMLRLLPLSTVAMAAAAFGVCGLVLGLFGTDSGTTLLAAVTVGVAAGALNTAAFAYLRRSESSASVDDRQITGAVGRVVLPVTGGHRGRIAIAAGGQQIYLSAHAMPDSSEEDELEVGAPVMVVEVRDGVAVVTRLDPELA